MNNSPKLKMLYIMDYLNKESSAEHPVTLNDIIEMLAGHGIKSERKALYNDIKLLQEFGMDIIKCKSKHFGYYVGARTFELVELKILADSVASSKFLTEKKSRSLIKKIETLTNKYEARQLTREVLVTDRVKMVNERIFYHVDKIHSAINNKVKISFRYCSYDMKKNRVARHDNMRYVVSPYELMWSNENYYLLANYPGHSDPISTFRVDRMEDIEILNEPAKEKDKNFNPVAYTRHCFNMFNGKKTEVTIAFDKSLVDTAIDKFGYETEITPYEDGRFTVTESIRISKAFFSWVAQFGRKAEIISPAEVRKEFLEAMREVISIYE